MGVTVAAVVFATPIYTTGRQLQADTGFLARGFFVAGDDLETMRKVLQIVLNHVLTRESNWTAADGVEQQSWYTGRDLGNDAVLAGHAEVQLDDDRAALEQPFRQGGRVLGVHLVSSLN